MGYWNGKTVIITGGGRAVLKDGRCGSIGYGIATAFAKEGANLVITGRNVKKLEDAKEELERLYGVKVLPVQADICAGADNEAVAAEGTAAKLAEVEAGLKDGTINVFDTANFTVAGETLTSYMADVDFDADYTKDTEAIKDGVFEESKHRSGPYFDIEIDGITLLDRNYG